MNLIETTDLIRRLALKKHVCYTTTIVFLNSGLFFIGELICVDRVKSTSWRPQKLKYPKLMGERAECHLK